MVKKILLNITVLSMLTLTGCSSNTNIDNSSTKTEQAKVSENSNTSSTTNEKNNESSKVENNFKKFTPLEEQSNYLGTAIKVFQNTYPNLAITKVELKSGEQPYSYIISAVDENKEYEYRYNSSLESLEKEEEKQLSENEKNGMKKNKEAIDMTTISNVDNIFNIVIGKDTSKKIVAWSVDRENSKVVWELSVLSNNQVSEVEVDDATQTVLQR